MKKSAIPLVLRLSVLVILFTLYSCTTTSRESISSGYTEVENPFLKIETGGHTDRINGLSFTPDSKQLISVSWDKTIRIWDVQSGTLLKILRSYSKEGRDGAFNAAALSPDGKVLAVSTAVESGGEIRLVSIPDGNILYRLMGHRSQFVETIAFSPDGKKLLTGSTDNREIWLWNLETQRHTVISNGLTNSFTVCFTPDDSKLVIGGLDGKVSVLSASGTHLIKQFEAHQGAISSLSVSPDGQHILTTGWDAAVRYWELSSGTLLLEVEKNKTTHNYMSVSVLSRNGESAIVGGMERGFAASSLRVYNLSTGNLGFKLFSGMALDPYRATVSPDGKWIAAASSRTPAVTSLWDAENGELKHTLTGTASSPMLSHINSDGSLSSGFTDKQIVFRSYTRIQNSENVVIIAIESPKEERDGGEGVQIMQDGKVKTVISCNIGGGFTTFQIVPDGSEVITGSIPGIIQAFSAESGQLLREYKGNTGWIRSLSVSEDGRFLLSDSDDQIHNLWNIKTGELLLSFFKSQDGEWASWTPQGFYNASTEGDRFVGWQANKGKMEAADYYSARQFRRYLYRPDVVEETLSSGSAVQSMADAGLQDVTVEKLILRAPAGVEISSVQKVTGSTAVIRMRILENRTTAPERLTLYINGAQVLTEEERKIDGLVAGDSFEREVPLSRGRNHIKALVENSWAEGSFEQVFETDSEEPPNSLPQLQFLGIGINRYPQLSEDQQLQTPDRDVRSMGEAFKALEGSLYEKVSIQLLTDEKNPITTETVKEFINQAQINADPQKTTILFIAGHGKTDRKGDYHFITANTVLSENLELSDLAIENSITWQDLHNTLDGIMGKRIVLVDTCDAGSVLNKSSFDWRKLEKEIHDVNAIIFSGSSRQESGLETDEGGLFTQAILTGIKNPEIYTNKALTISDLGSYVQETVPELTRSLLISQYRGVKIIQKEEVNNDELSGILDMAQTPVLSIPKGMEDFVFYQLE